MRPLVTGTTVTGSNLTSTTGTWTNATTYAREWLRDGSPIAGATGAVYALVGADEGALIAVNVTATGPGGEASAESLPVGPIRRRRRGQTLPRHEDDGPMPSASPASRARETSAKKRKR